MREKVLVVLSVLAVAGLITPAAAGVMAQLRSQEFQIDVDSVMFVYPESTPYVPTPEFSVRAGEVDTFLFGPEVEWTDEGVLVFYAVERVGMPELRIMPLVADSWYELPTSADEPPAIMFSRTAGGVHDRTRSRATQSRLVPLSTPARGSIGLVCEVANTAPALIEVFDETGQLLRTLADGVIATGEHRFAWDGCDAQGRKVGTGIYLVRLSAGSELAIAKIVLTE
jgi:hypothetical protein